MIVIQFLFSRLNNIQLRYNSCFLERTQHNCNTILVLQTEQNTIAIKALFQNLTNDREREREWGERENILAQVRGVHHRNFSWV